VFTVPITEVGGYVVQFHAAYGKVPFDGEKPFREAPPIIETIEQTIYFASRKPNDSVDAA
jgi:hypothetical protein